MNSSSVLPFLVKDSHVFVLLGRQTNWNANDDKNNEFYCDFGGFKEKDESVKMTAIRECFEETRGAIGDINSLEVLIDENPNYIDHNTHRTYLVNVSHLEKSDVLRKFSNFKNTKNKLEFMEVESLCWVKVDNLFKKVFSMQGSNETDFPLRPCFKENLKENASRIQDLFDHHVKKENVTIRTIKAIVKWIKSIPGKLENLFKNIIKRNTKPKDFTHKNIFSLLKVRRKTTLLEQLKEKILKENVDPQSTALEFIAVLNSYRNYENSKNPEFNQRHKNNLLKFSQCLPFLDQIICKIEDPKLKFKLKLITAQLPYNGDRDKLSNLHLSTKDQLHFLQQKLLKRKDKTQNEKELKRINKTLLWIEKQLSKDETEMQIPRWTHATTRAWGETHLQNRQVPVTHGKALKGAWVSTKFEIDDETFGGDIGWGFSQDLIGKNIEDRITACFSLDGLSRWRGLQEDISLEKHLCLVSGSKADDKEQRRSEKENLRLLLQENNLGHIQVFSKDQFNFMINFFHEKLGCPNLPTYTWGL